MKRFAPFVARMLVEQLQRWEGQVRTAITELQGRPQWNYRNIADWRSGPTHVTAALWDWLEVDCTSAHRPVFLPDPAPDNVGAHIVTVRRESSGSNFLYVYRRSDNTLLLGVSSANAWARWTSTGSEWRYIQ